jgi:Tfp pilus assembly protein PilF
MVLILCSGGCASTTDERFREYNTDGVHLFERGDYSAARESFQAALQIKADDPAVLYNIGECYARQGGATKAEYFYNECLRKSPNHTACRHALAQLMVRTGRGAEAARMVEDWITHDPQQAAPYAEDGWLFHEAGDLPRAQARLQQALDIDPHNVRALNELALIYEAMHRPDRSLVLYERSLAQDKHQPDVVKRLDKLKAEGAERPRLE